MRFLKNTLVCDDQGAAVIEFAIVLPLLLVLMFGMIEFSLFMYNKQVLTNAVREGARTGVVMRMAPRDLTAEKKLIEARVKEYSENFMITFGDDKDPVVDEPVYDLGTEGVVSIGDTLTVTATFDYTFLVLPNFVGSLADSLKIKAVSVMRME